MGKEEYYRYTIVKATERPLMARTIKWWNTDLQNNIIEPQNILSKGICTQKTYISYGYIYTKFLEKLNF